MRIHINNFDYPFDPALIAQYPLSKRDQARLLVLDRANGTIEHRRFFEIGEYLDSGDLLVLNNTKVIPCRLSGKKEVTGGCVDLLLVKKVKDDIWEVIADKKLREGIKITFSQSCWCEVLGSACIERSEKSNSHYVAVKFYYKGNWDTLISEIGQMPLPPYIKRDPCNGDKEWYQTVYASENGSIAAPTAGLHFTEELLNSLKAKGVLTAYVTLHVGTGTFRPVKVDRIEEHKMEREWVEVKGDVVNIIKTTRIKGGRVIAVGTTSVRALEEASLMSGELTPLKGETVLFIYPGFKFSVVDTLMTNFHLPRSTLLMLVTAFAGRENIFKAYAEAVALKYRFYSYGDAMLII